MAQTYGIGMMIWSPLAGGFLTGKYRRNAAPPDVARFRTTGEQNTWVDRHFVDKAFAVTELLAMIANEKQCTPAQLALAWTMRHAAVASIVLGARTVAQLNEQLGALDVKITPDDSARFDEFSPPGGVIVPYYLDDSLADFRPHRHRW
jgi:aryl-alcohol dehydrogenase-like predicted oxidoreductase